MPITSPIDEKRFNELTKPILGLPIARVWFGDFTALYVEIGPLSERYAKSGLSKGRYTAYLGFDWILESGDNHELYVSSSTTARCVGSALISATINNISASPKGGLVLELSSKRSLRSIVSDRDGTDWTIHFADKTCIAAETNSLVIESTPT